MGALTLAPCSAPRTSSRVSPRLDSCEGFTCTRTAGRTLPAIETRPTPCTCASFCAMIESARSFTSRSCRLSEVSLRVRIGASAGLTRLYTGGYGRLFGSVPLAELIADCTSCAAMSMSRSMLNCSTMVDSPADESELIMLSPEIWPNWRSSGVVTSAAMVVALAPGYWVVTTRLGASISGNADTGNWR